MLVKGAADEREVQDVRLSLLLAFLTVLICSPFHLQNLTVNFVCLSCSDWLPKAYTVDILTSLLILSKFLYFLFGNGDSFWGGGSIHVIAPACPAHLNNGDNFANDCSFSIPNTSVFLQVCAKLWKFCSNFYVHTTVANCTKVLWACDSNLVKLCDARTCKDPVKILHMPQQLSCLVMCQIYVLTGSLELKLLQKEFSQDLSYELLDASWNESQIKPGQLRVF